VTLNQLLHFVLKSTLTSFRAIQPVHFTQ